jgi:hypothetical protein
MALLNLELLEDCHVREMAVEREADDWDSLKHVHRIVCGIQPVSICTVGERTRAVFDDNDGAIANGEDREVARPDECVLHQVFVSSFNDACWVVIVCSTYDVLEQAEGEADEDRIERNQFPAAPHGIGIVADTVVGEEGVRVEERQKLVRNNI